MRRFFREFIRRWNADETGSPAVEFALVAPIVLILLMGVLDFGLAVRAKSEMSQAARAGLQRGFANMWNSAAIVTAARTSFETSSIDANTINVVSTWACYCDNAVQSPCDQAAANNLTCVSGSLPAFYLTVDVSRPYNMLIDYYLFPQSFNVSGTATARMQR